MRERVGGRQRQWLGAALVATLLLALAVGVFMATPAWTGVLRLLLPALNAGTAPRFLRQ